MSTNEQAQSEAVQDQFYADSGYDWTDPAGADVRKVWLAGRASALALPLSAGAVTGPSGTPSSQWRANGEVDPHAGHYDGERAALCMGDLTDDELANGAFMNYDRPFDIDAVLTKKPGYHPPIAWMTAVKDRIRWLSRSLEKALQSPPVAAPADGIKMVPHWAVAGETFCLFCEKLGHRTTECWSTHALSTPASRELALLAAAATTTGEAAAPDAQPVSDMLDAVAGIEAAVDAINAKINEPREPGWSYRNTISTNREFVREHCARIRATLGALSASQAHGKSEALAYPAMPKPYTTEYDDIDKEDVPCYALAQVHAAIDADRAQRPAAPADGAALAEPSERQIAEAMVAVSDPLAWGKLDSPATMLQEFARALASAQGDAAPAHPDARDAALQACRSTCDRIIEQYEGWGVQCGVDFHALRKSIDAALAASGTSQEGGAS